MIEILYEKFRNEVSCQTSCLDWGVFPVDILDKDRKDGTQYKKEQNWTAHGQKKLLIFTWKKHLDRDVEENKGENKRAET